MTGKGDGREYRAYPNLRNARWLFPANHPVARRAGIEGLFQPGSPKGRLLKRLISTGILPGERVFLEDEALTRLESEVTGALGEAKPTFAFYIGVPGAYRKVTSQVMTPQGVTLGFAKIANSAPAQKDVEAERRNLLRLAGSDGLRGSIPEVLHHFDWQRSKVLLMTGGPTRPGPARLSGLHMGFCKDLFLPFAEERAFADSPMLARMLDAHRRLESELPGHLSASFRRALDLVQKKLGGVVLPLSVAHRDFAPWNTRLRERGLFVFDWDRAEEGVTPLYDAFHFQVIQAVLFGRREPLPDLRFTLDLLDALWPGGRTHLSWLYLCYLLDMSLMYSEAQVVAPGVGEQRVWRWFTDRVETFAGGESPPELGS